MISWFKSLRRDTTAKSSKKHSHGHCEHCKKQFEYQLIHNGFNDSAYAYCNACGTTALLDGWKIPAYIKMPIHQKITSETEMYLAPCQCGGTFKADASPRCPHCLKTLSADKAADYIEPQAEGTKKGWRWQRSWTGLYCIVINNKIVHNVWKQT